MKIRKTLSILTSILIFLVIIIAMSLQHSGNVLASGTTLVNVSSPSQPVSAGQQFTVNIIIQPNSAIAGAQFNLSFNPVLVTVNSVTEGTLFNQNGSNTYFMPGTINNSSGTISGVAGATIGAGHTVSNAANFATISMTAHTTGGTCALTLSNVIIADSNGQSVAVGTANGQVIISGITPTTASTTTTTTVAPPSGSDGGGSPVAPASIAGVINLTSAIDAKGTFNQDVLAFSDDSNFLMRIITGTQNTTSSGALLSQISILHVATTPAFPANAGIVGLAYDFTPSGATFSPPATGRFGYNPALIPAGIAETSLQIAYYDSSAKVWIALPSTVDTNTHIIYAQISHFTPYAVTYGIPDSMPVTSTTPTTLAVISTTNSAVPVTTVSTSITVTTQVVITITTSKLPVTAGVATESKTTTASISLPDKTQPPTTDVTMAAKVFKLNALAITLGVATILIIITVVTILWIRRNMLKNSQKH